MKKMLCLAVFALGVAMPAVAADWVLIAINNNDVVILGDADSRTIEHGLKQGSPSRKRVAMENFLIQLKRWKKWIAVVNVVGL